MHGQKYRGISNSCNVTTYWHFTVKLTTGSQFQFELENFDVVLKNKCYSNDSYN